MSSAAEGQDRRVVTRAAATADPCVRAYHVSVTRPRTAPRWHRELSAKSGYGSETGEGVVVSEATVCGLEGRGIQNDDLVASRR